MQPLYLFTRKLVQHIPYSEHIHNAESTVVQTVTGTHVSGTFVPEVSAVVGTDVSLKAAVVVCLENIKNTRVAVAVAVACLGEVSVFKVLDVTDVGKSYSVTMLANDICNIVVGICTKASGAKSETVELFAELKNIA